MTQICVKFNESTFDKKMMRAKSLDTKGSILVATRQLGSVLVEMGLLSQKVVTDAADRAVKMKSRLGDLLVSEGLITATQLSKALANQYGLEYIDLDTILVNSLTAQLVPEKVARMHFIVPLEAKNGQITLVTNDPVHLAKLDNLDSRFGAPIRVKVSTLPQLESALNKVYARESSVDKIVKVLSKSHDPESPVKNAALVLHTSGNEADPSIESLVNKIIEKALISRASDIHMDPAEGLVRVRIRVDGVLRELNHYPLPIHQSVTSRIKVLANLDIAEKRQPQDGGFHHPYGQVDVRVATLPTVHGEKLVLRLLDHKKMRSSLAEIGMNPSLEESVQNLLKRPHGIFFITGPTGSGKTTTLYSLLNQLDAVEKNVISVEDPVEYKFDVINQVQVNEKAGLSFASLLRNILRQDPDVIMIGEVRDQETADIAIRAALTGHLVLSTLHTNDAVSTHTRLMDMGIEPFLISSALVATLAQRLVRVLCTNCRKAMKVTEKDAKLLGSASIQAGMSVFGPGGCEACLGSGYKHRTALFEFLPVDHALQRAITDRYSEAEIAATLAENGFKTMRHDGITKVLAGITSIDEVLKVTL